MTNRHFLGLWVSLVILPVISFSSASGSGGNAVGQENSQLSLTLYVRDVLVEEGRKSAIVLDFANNSDDSFRIADTLRVYPFLISDNGLWVPWDANPQDMYGKGNPRIVLKVGYPRQPQRYFTFSLLDNGVVHTKYVDIAGKSSSLIQFEVPANAFVPGRCYLQAAYIDSKGNELAQSQATPVECVNVEKQPTTKPASGGPQTLPAEGVSIDRWGDPIDGKRMRIDIHRDSFDAGMPIDCGIILENVSPTAIEIGDPGGAPTYDSIVYEITMPGGKRSPLTMLGSARSLHPHYSTVLKRLPSGEMIEEGTPQLNRAYDMTLSGEYTIVGVWRLPSDSEPKNIIEVRSSPVTITVR